jgi:NADPH:quinone reductase-like Zn-dependent oxidoreductase
MSSPDVMRAIITTASKTAKLASDVAVPKLLKGEILVKVEAVTLNPTE